jgi:hypothetical protein
MRVFLLDMWMDLREKRLAPVAALLLAGIIAVPIVLAKGEKAPPPAPVAPTASTAPATPVVVAGTSDRAKKDSKLQVFTARDPFEATGAAATSGSTTPATTPTSSTGTSTTSTPTPTPGTGTTTPGGAPTGSQPTPGTGTGTTGTTTPETKPVLYTYTANLKFGVAGDMTTYKDVKRLQLMPSDTKPKIVFLGVTATAKTAVFLVDSNIRVNTSEGRCRPSPSQCTFLYLRPDDQHDQATLTDSDGTVLHVRLLAINRVTVSSSAGGGNSGSGNSNGSTKSKRSPAFTGNATSTGTDTTTAPADSPPGEPSKPFTYQQFFADSSSSSPGK